MFGKLETRVGLFVVTAISIFFYMGFQIGSFRFDRGKYYEYTLYFKDIEGLTKKADVRIAGVKVGWVKQRHLVPGDHFMAKVDIMILKNYSLYHDAYAVVRQEGLLGPKYLEIVPGNPLLEPINPGDSLGKPSIEPASIDTLLRAVETIATHVEDVTNSFQKALGNSKGNEKLDLIINNLCSATTRIASFSQALDSSLSKNETNIDTFLNMGQSITGVARNLEEKILPTFQKSMETISDVFDRDFNRVATKLEHTAQALEDASVQAHKGFKSVTTVIEKIESGEGLLGKLINEDETYDDLKIAVGGLKNSFARLDMIDVIFDSHFEAMHKPAENYAHEDSKGYFYTKVYPNEDYFYLVELVSSERGFIDRNEVHRSYCDNNGCPISDDTLTLTDRDRLEFIFNKKEEVFIRNSLRFGIQFGKMFGNTALRFGLFEGSVGVGIDFDMPIASNKIRWISSVQGFDFTGWNRKNDRRPHIKWLNKIFFLRNAYFVFGADDIVSKNNARAFFGAGIRFGDDEIKYLFSGVNNVRNINSC